MKKSKEALLFGSEPGNMKASLKNKKAYLIMGLAICLSVMACRKDLIPQPTKKIEKPASTKELKASVDFNWSTTSSFDFEITPTKKGLLLIQDVKANVIYKALLQPNVTFKQNITVPSSVSKLNVYFNGNKEEITVPGQTKFVSKL